MMSFKPIDAQQWARAEAFYYYANIAPTNYSVTNSLDVTKTYALLKQRGCKFFPAYLYVMSRVIREIEQLRIGINEGQLGVWETLHPVYPCFHPENQTVSLLWTEYQADFSQFYQSYLADVEEYGRDLGMLTKKGSPPVNAYVVSCIPWFSFSSFSLHYHQQKDYYFPSKDYYFPSLEAGKFVEAEGKKRLPLSITVHHAATDGYHLKLFYDEVQHLFDHPEQWV
ncbi:chloramphenicol acetyltransferase CAT [Enterococcus florum]|uniref:Chloramphenicol acetyltransferase CAT n=1 Tax=Enterococcus florum TaxID=2480627 RepID=A0A4P5P878_9ENTE|nr:chloramphenicol acetyltransferase [Enterococcus florum]GCF94215.1 chloramphenicol acetyltransferase CAT [Enterococcus florum]